MKTKDEILAAMTNVLVEQFEIDRSKILPTSHLYTDLDIDSIDAVDLVVKLQHLTGKKVDPERFKQVRTVQDVVDAVYALMNP